MSDPTTDPQPDGVDRGTHVRPKVYITSDIPGVGGRIKERPEDFLVEELPLYQPAGEGEHIYLFVEKKNFSTFDLIGLMATHFGVDRKDVGYAGLKDKVAITRQVVSVYAPGKKIEDFPQISHERVGVLWVDYHANKLRPGHLAGNRFSVRIRAVDPTRVRDAHRVLERLKAIGVPNRVGEQRFGQLQNNHRVGAAIILGNNREALDLMLGPSAEFPQVTPVARAHYAKGEFQDALRNMPRGAKAEQAALRALIHRQPPGKAIRAIDEGARRFFFSAFQSAVFNAVLDERVAEGTIGDLKTGDLAFKHGNRAVFAVDDAVLADATTRARLSQFEISPSGPMWGASMMRAAGEIDRVELAALERSGVMFDDLVKFDQARPGMLEGSRRPFRVPLIDPEVEGGVDEHGPFIRCAFELPRGSFATVVLREIMKPPEELAGEEN